MGRYLRHLGFTTPALNSQSAGLCDWKGKVSTFALGNARQAFSTTGISKRRCLKLAESSRISVALKVAQTVFTHFKLHTKDHRPRHTTLHAPDFTRYNISLGPTYQPSTNANTHTHTQAHKHTSTTAKTNTHTQSKGVRLRHHGRDCTVKSSSLAEKHKTETEKQHPPPFNSHGITQALGGF